MTPAELHAEVRAALDAAEADLRQIAGTPAPWYVGHTQSPYLPASIIGGGEWSRTVAYGVPFRDAHLVVALRNTASSAYGGARRIVERHAPTAAGRCEHCWGRRRADAVWPCPDYRDAAAVLPYLEPEVARALHP